MHSSQLKALRRLRIPSRRRRLRQALEADDASLTWTNADVQKLMRDFNKIFLFGAIMKTEFYWSTEMDTVHRDSSPLSDSSSDGSQSSCASVMLACSGISRRSTRGDFHRIDMRPSEVSTDFAVGEGEQLGIARAKDRLGTILHEMIHCFIRQHVCRECDVRTMPDGIIMQQGRGFQMIAMASEDISKELLGLKVHVGRIVGIYADLGMRTDRHAGPSVHDMEMYGFLDPLENRPAWRRDGILGNHSFLERIESEEPEDVSMIDDDSEVDDDQWEDIC
ncbi:hypothetical protein FB567DRAFT_527350 [Paraphoma chrysanthemicola]|uniref:SprT-like domain-containing protein n=1 Tax=Paraphoma chrysanthemicola TaxID=798071 RepID=A0A8K0R605_9PLEO|nr:hypothetical protein FB567DRAFT_527350 [Paraphoma chrysanthemicola]